MRTVNIKTHRVEDSDASPAFGREISLQYLNSKEWENIFSFKKKLLKKLGKYIEYIQKNGPESSQFTAENKTLLKKNSLRHDSRFYAAITNIQEDIEGHYEFKLERKPTRIMISFTKNKGYLMCFDHNHSALNTSK